MTKGKTMNATELVQHVARRSGTRPTRRRNFTRELLDARKNGSVIVASLAPYNGEPVEYAPRFKTDPRPWLRKDAHGCEWRFSGRECHTVPACGQRMIAFKTGRYVTCTLPAGHERKAHRSD